MFGGISCHSIGSCYSSDYTSSLNDLRLKLTGAPWILIAGADSGRGVDIQASLGPVYLIIAVPGLRQCDLNQFCGRGYRSVVKPQPVKSTVFTFTHAPLDLV